MSLLAPAGLILSLLVPVVIAIHLWRVRHRHYTLSSTLLWSRVLAETPLRRPRHLPTRYLLLALQLAVLVCGVAALARPAWTVASAQRRLLVAVDSSLAMSATDVRPSRLALALERTRLLIDSLGSGDTLTLVDVGPAPRVLITSGDHTALRRALSLIVPGDGPSSLAEDGPLLAGLATAEGPRTAAYLFAPLGASPAALDLLRRAVPGLHIQALGTSGEDRGVAGLSVSCVAAACEAYARLVNTASHPVITEVRATVDGAGTAERVTLPAESAVPLDLLLPTGARTVALHLEGHDALPADDTAWAIVPLPVHRTVLLVSSDPTSPLAQVLRVIPNLTLRVTTPDAYSDALTLHVDLTILDNVDDNTVEPPGNLLIVNPVSGGTLLTMEGTSTAPGVATVDESSPLLQNVDLSSLVIAAATRVPLPPWAHADIASNAGPLLLSGVTGGRRVAALLFDPRPTATTNASNLDTLLAFPALLQNAVEALAPTVPSAVTSGQVVASPVTRQGSVRLQPVLERPARAVTLSSSGDLAVLPALRPGLYNVTGGPGDAANRIAANAPVPGDPAAAGGATTAGGASPPATGTIAGIMPVTVPPWDLWAAFAALALLALCGEWWYYVRHT